MQPLSTVNYVTKKYAFRECPIVLAQLLNTTRVRFALLQTNCYLDVQSRVLNWRHRATAWTKGAIVEVAGPTYRDIDHCNDLIEAIVPFYAHRRPYAEILPNGNRHVSLKRRCQRTQKSSRPWSSMPVTKECMSTQMSNACDQPVNYHYKDPCVVMNNCESHIYVEPNDDIHTTLRCSPPESRNVRCHTLPKIGQFTSEHPVNHYSLMINKHDRNQYKNETYLNVNYSADPMDGEIHDQNEHNVTNATELELHTNHRGPIERRPSFPRPPLFESQRSARIAAHSLKAAAVRASLEKMKDDKYKVLRQTVPLPPPPPQSKLQKSSASVTTLNKPFSNTPTRCNPPRASRESATKPTGDNVGLASLQMSSGAIEKTTNLVPKFIPSKRMHSAPPTSSAKLAVIKGRGDKGGNRIEDQLTKPGNLSKYSVQTKAPSVNAGKHVELRSAQVMTTQDTVSSDPHKLVNDDLSKTDRKGVKDEAASAHFTNSLPDRYRLLLGCGGYSGMDATSDAFESNYSFASMMDNNPSFTVKTSFGQNKQNQEEEKRGGSGGGVREQSKVFQGPMYAFPQSRSSSSTSLILQSNTPMLVSNHDGPDAVFITPGEAGECHVKSTRCTPHDTIQAINKTITDAAELHLKPVRLKPGGHAGPDSTIFSDVSSSDMKVYSLQLPNQTMIEPHSVKTEKKEVWTTVTPELPVARVTNLHGPKLNVQDADYSEQVSPLHPPSLGSTFRPKLFERLEGNSCETTETQELNVSEKCTRDPHMNNEQALRQNYLSVKEPLVDDPRESERKNARMDDNHLIASSSMSKLSKETLKGTSVAINAIYSPRSETVMHETGQKLSPSSAAVSRQSARQSSSSLAKQNRLEARSRDNRGGRKNVRDSIPPTSPNRTARSPKETKLSPSSFPENQRVQKQAELQSREQRTRLKPTLDYATPVSSGKTPVPRNPEYDASSPRSAARERPMNNQQTIRMPKFNSTPPKAISSMSASKASSQRDSRPANKTAIDRSLADSAALTPLHLPRPSPTSTLMTKTRDCKGEVADPLNTTTALENPVGQVGEIPGQSLRSPCFSLPGASVGHLPSPASSDAFVGFRSPYSCQACESLDQQPVVTSSSSVETDHSSTENSSDGLSITDSNEGTPYPFPERKASTGLFGSVDRCVDPAIAHFHNLTQMRLKNDPIKQYESRLSNRAGTKHKRKGSSAETQALCDSYDYRKDRFRSKSVYSKVLRCLSFEWCVGD